ncbi:MAG: DEAD/DEAH box helicase [Pseudomonadota bacterium]
MLAPLKAALDARGYETLTPVQTAVTDPALAAADLLVSAQTGSGKTVAFGLAIAPTLLGADAALGPAGAPLGLVVTPTRELALQVARELRWLYAEAGARIATAVGGMDARDERRALDRGAHIVVATPGRLRDHITRGAIDLAQIRAAVLDEADEMLDLGFSEDLEFILGTCPDDRRTLLFSATVPPSILSLAARYQRDAQRVNVAAGARQHADIAYTAMMVAPHDTDAAVFNTLRYHDAPNAIVFCNTRAAVGRLTARLSNRGFAVVALSGELTQSERTNALQAMRDGRARVCVATDVAARGIDLPGLDLVIHAELPSSGETLLHRSGRTGRAGRKGTSALIVTSRTRGRALRALKSAKVDAEWVDAPSAEAVLARDRACLLEDPMWTDPEGGEDAALAALLAERFDARALALAVARLHGARLSAPEVLSDAAMPAPKARAPFGPSVWFAVPGGRDQDAQVRRLLPQVCKAAGITKDAVGAIRVLETTTLIEIAKAVADGFAPDIALENGPLTRLDIVPDGAERPARAPSGGKPPRKGPARAKLAGPRKPAHPATADGPKPAKAPPPPKPPRADKAAPTSKPARAAEPKADRPAKVKPPKPGNRKGKPPVHPRTGQPMAPKVGKPNSKKNKARRAAAAAKGGDQPPRRKT